MTWTCGPLLAARMQASLSLLLETADLLHTGPHASLLRSVISLLAPIGLDGDSRTAATKIVAMVNHLDRHATLRDLLHDTTLTLARLATPLDKQNQPEALAASCAVDDALATLADDALTAGMIAKIDTLELTLRNVTMSWRAAVNTRVATGANTPSAREREAEREIEALRNELTTMNATLDHLYN